MFLPAEAETENESDDDDEDDEDEDDAPTSDEPEEVKVAWEELMLIQKEIDRYSGIKLDLEQDISSTRKMQKRLEDVSFRSLFLSP